MSVLCIHGHLQAVVGIAADCEGAVCLRRPPDKLDSLTTATIIEMALPQSDRAKDFSRQVMAIEIRADYVSIAQLPADIPALQRRNLSR